MMMPFFVVTIGYEDGFNISNLSGFGDHDIQCLRKVLPKKLKM